MASRLGLHIFHGLDGFRRDDRGTAVVFVATSILVLAAAAGFAFDTGRGYMVKARLSQAVDAAALAGGRSITPGGGGGYAAQIDKYFKANFPDGYMGATVDGPIIGVSGGNTTITVSATADIPPTLMKALSADSIRVSARAQVTRAIRGLEVALVLDNSGSMGKDGKMAALKAAANTFLDTVYGSNDVIEDVHVALVPFTGRTNLSAHPKIFPTAPPVTDHVCLDMREAPHATSDTPPGGVDESNAYSHYSGHRSPPSFLYRHFVCPDAGILPLTQPKEAIKTRIDAMDSGGCTRYDVGTVWGWRALSPRYRGLWNGTGGGLPLDYDEPLMDKAIVIMTDGEMSDCTGDPFTKRQLEDQFEGICSDMKAAGIIVYTITFQLDEEDDEDTNALFSSCASSEERAFRSPTAKQLQSAFTTIAGDLSTLRLTQ